MGYYNTKKWGGKVLTVEKKRKFLIDTAFIVLVGIILYFLFKFCTIYLLPFLIGLLLAVLVQRPANFISKKTKISKGLLSVFLVIVLYLVTISIISAICVLIYQKASDLVSTLPQYISVIGGTVSDLSAKFANILNDLPEEIVSAVNALPETVISGLTEFVTSFLSSSATAVAKNAPSLLITVIVTVVASCYLAKDYDGIMKYVHARISERANRIITDTKDIFFSSILKMLKSYFLLMMITFAELSIGLLIIGIKNPVTVAAIIAFVDLLPVLGTGAVVIPWAIISLITGNIWRGIGLALLYLVITIVRNFLEPKIIGDQVGLYPLLTLLSMFVGLRLFGILGMFAFPITIIVLAGLQNRGTIKLFGK